MADFVFDNALKPRPRGSQVLVAGPLTVDAATSSWDARQREAGEDDPRTAATQFSASPAAAPATIAPQAAAKNVSIDRVMHEFGEVELSDDLPLRKLR